MSNRFCTEFSTKYFRSLSEIKGNPGARYGLRYQILVVLLCFFIRSAVN